MKTFQHNFDKFSPDAIAQGGRGENLFAYSSRQNFLCFGGAGTAELLGNWIIISKRLTMPD
jgi:hypothetical protein